MSVNMPAAEVAIDEELVRQLLEFAVPGGGVVADQLAASIGWDNVIYRLGSDLVVRLPRRKMGAGTRDDPRLGGDRSARRDARRALGSAGCDREGCYRSAVSRVTFAKTPA